VRRPARSERGIVTAETAMALPVLLALTLALVWLLSLGLTQVLVLDASREAARSLARGDPVASALAAGRRVAPAGSDFAIHQEDTWVEVEVTAPAGRPSGLLGFLPSVRLIGRSVAQVEEGVQ
jgi:hypothetical protein